MLSQSGLQEAAVLGSSNPYGPVPSASYSTHRRGSRTRRASPLRLKLKAVDHIRPTAGFIIQSGYAFLPTRPDLAAITSDAWLGATASSHLRMVTSSRLPPINSLPVLVVRIAVFGTGS